VRPPESRRHQPAGAPPPNSRTRLRTESIGSPSPAAGGATADGRLAGASSERSSSRLSSRGVALISFLV
jgi:hypothetical protein